MPYGLAGFGMERVRRAVHSPGPAFVYVRYIEAETSGPEIDPERLQTLIDEKAVRNPDPTAGIPFIHLDDLLDGFRGTRLEPDDVITASAMECHRQEQLRQQK
jgi:hypothetical protein